MESDRLTGLALMSVHTNRPVNREKILEDFVASEGVDQTLVFN